MRILCSLAVVAFVMSVVGVSVSPHVYQWELIVADCTVLLWVFVAWLESEMLRKRP